MTENEQIMHINCGYRFGKTIPPEFIKDFRHRFEKLKSGKDQLRWESFNEGFQVAIEERRIKREKQLKQIRELNGYGREL